MKSIVPAFVIIGLFVLNIGCKSKPEPYTDKRFTIASKETLKIRELDMTITNNGCGRKWIVEGDNPAFERAYCELIIEKDGKTINAGNSREPVIIGDITIDIDRMNPWGSWEDSVPPGGCRLWVRRTGTQ